MKFAQACLSMALIATGAMAQTNVTNSNNGVSGAVPVYSGTAALGAGSTSSIHQSGSNIGIGTSSPSATLDVNSPSYGLGSGDGLWIYEGGNANNGGLALRTTANLIGSIVSLGSDSSLDFQTNNNGAGVDAMRINQYGQIGIGTQTPSSPVDVLATGGQEIALGGGSSTGSELKFLYMNVAHFSIYNSGNGYLTIANTSGLSQTNTKGTPLMSIATGGNVGIGTTAPGYQLDVTGVIHSTGGVVFPDGSVQTTAFSPTLCGGDYAESVDVTGDRKNFEPGDVLVIDPENPGKFLKSAEPYSTLVSGVFSTKPGLVGRRQTSPKGPDEIPMAVVGIVPTKVTTENGPIRTGDLLVTSSTTGLAMKGTDRNRLQGAVIGKALGSLDSGSGVIEVLVTLQ